MAGLAVLAGFVAAFASCNAVADTSNVVRNAETVWIRLIPGKPSLDGEVLTADLLLDFSKPIAGLETGASAEVLNTIFTFECAEAAKQMTAKSVIKYAEAVYLLTVVNLPGTTGIAKVTVNRPNIEPTFRLWSFDGQSIVDLEGPAMTSFCFEAGEKNPLLASDAPGALNQSERTVLVMLPIGSNASDLTPTVGVADGCTYTPEGAQDFSDSAAHPVIYRVTEAESGAHRDYEVRVLVQQANWVSAPDIALTAGYGEFGYVITHSNPPADSYTISYIEEHQTEAAVVKAGTELAGSTSTSGTISSLTGATYYSVLVTAHKDDYADCDSAIVRDVALAHVTNPATRLYVKEGGNGNGSSWDNASGNVQTMIDQLGSGGGEIWVAAGRYTPNSVLHEVFTGYYSEYGFFKIEQDGIKLYGGFPAGITSSTSADAAMCRREAGFKADGTLKSWAAACETTLSGDINGDDTYHTTTGFLTDGYEENTMVVVSFNTQNITAAILDGFTVKGSRNGPGIIILSSCSPFLRNLIVTGNRSYGNGGGGIYNRGSPILVNSTIRGNGAGYGGGICNESLDDNTYRAPILINVVIEGNEADIYGGGGMYNGGGGGMPIVPILINVLITGNSANDDNGGGGGINNYEGDSNVIANILINVTIAGNRSSGKGGGIYNRYGTTDLRNSIVWGNDAPTGAQVEGSGFSWVNSINGGGSDPFETSVPASSAPTGAGNYRLKSGSAAVDTGASTPGTPSATYWQAAALGTWDAFWSALKDLDGKPRKVGAAVDMGAYERQ
jgi:hypothetical protein